MSLRTEIRAALDDVTPPAPTLEHKVEVFVMAGDRVRVVRPRRGGVRWTRQLRGPLSLVAAVLVFVLLGGLILGGRLLRDLNPPPQGINQADLKRLESRPLRAFPTVRAGDPCPTSPLTDVSAHGPQALLFGEGPVYATQLGYLQEITNWGTWSVMSATVDPTKASGPILIRAIDLQTHARVVFGLYPFTPSGGAGNGIPTGTPTGGTDVVQGAKVQEYPEVVVDLSRPFALTKPGDWPIYKSFVGYPKAARGCIGFQIDGKDFTELIVVE